MPRIFHALYWASLLTHRKGWLVLLFVLLGAQILNAQSRAFNKFIQVGQEEGLPGVSVRALCQDRNGMIWVGVEGKGVARFDGHSFQTYQMEEDGSGIVNNYVESIHQDPKGMIWIGTENGLSVIDPMDESITSFIPDPGRSGGLVGSRVFAIESDSTGRVWVGTDNGLCWYDQVSNRFERIATPDQYRVLRFPQVSGIYVHNDEYLLLGCSGAVFKVDLETLRMERLEWKGEISDKPIPGDVYSIVWDGSRHFWVGTDQGLFKLDPLDWSFTVFQPRDPRDSAIVTELKTLVFDRQGNLWCGTWANGIIVIPKNSEDVVMVQRDIRYRDGLKSNSIRDIIVDHSGLVWIGTKIEGIHVYDPRKETFIHERGSPYFEDGLKDPQVVSLATYGKDLFIGTVATGLFIYNTETRKYRHYRHKEGDPNSLVHNRIHQTLLDSKSRMWVCSDGGLTLFDRETGLSKNYAHPFCRSISELGDGTLVVGTKNGVVIWNDALEEWRDFEVTAGPDISLNSTFDFMEQYVASDGRLWLGSRNDGVFIFDPDTGIVLNPFEFKIKDGSSISVASPRCFFEDSKGRFWIGTKLNGLFQFDPQTLEVISHVDTSKLIGSASAFDMVEGADGEFWINTTNGLFRYNPDTGDTYLFGLEYGIQSLVFESKTCVKNEQGWIFVGGPNGFNIFDPHIVKPVIYQNPFQITVFSVNDMVVARNVEKSFDVTLGYKENRLYFQFALLDYSFLGSNVYEYQLLGFDDKPRVLTKGNSASYLALPPGKYVFEVSGQNPDEVSGLSKRTLRIGVKIRKPFWQEWVFVASCVLAGTFVIIRLTRFFVSLEQRKNRQLELLVAERTKALASANEELLQSQDEIQQRGEEIERQNHELAKHRDYLGVLVEERTKELEVARDRAEESDRLKSSFLANMSHEIRTPLNAILGFSELVREEVRMDVRLKEYLDTIQSNGDMLLRLINDIIDFSIIESGHLKFSMAEIDVLEFAENNSATFRQIVKRSRPEVEYRELFELDRNCQYLVFGDSKRLKQILMNLLSNACKFTTNGSITFKVVHLSEPDRIEFSVTDTGRGIAKEDQKKIFERFYKVEHTESEQVSGSGLGLSISSYIAKMMDAELSVDSEIGSGSAFKASFPLLRIVQREFAKPSQEDVSLSKIPDWSRFHILVVEDGMFNFRLLSEMLRKTGAQITWAKDGLEAVELCKEHKESLSLLLMDIRLPKIDGVEALRRIREFAPDIPAIAQTAHAMVEETSTILQAGFVASIAKPLSQIQLYDTLARELDKQTSGGGMRSI